MNKVIVPEHVAKAVEKENLQKVEKEKTPEAVKDIAELKDDTTRDRMDQQKELKLIDIGLKQL